MGNIFGLHHRLIDEWALSWHLVILFVESPIHGLNASPFFIFFAQRRLILVAICHQFDIPISSDISLGKFCQLS